MEDIYQRVSGGCWRSNNTSELKPEQIGGKKSLPPRWLQRIHFQMANLSAGISTLWFIIAKAPPLSSMCFKHWRKWTCLRGWMSSDSIAAAHASWWSVFRLVCKFNSHTHTQHKVLHAIRFSPPVCACVCVDIFSNGSAPTVVCVSNAMCQGGIMLRSQSDGP